ncbi:MAG: hypothetical protein GY761_04085 [Hyphomicrobiales bacterium]|nr:hypothetical protein [Hyphomicrobiales bacterium]
MEVALPLLLQAGTAVAAGYATSKLIGDPGKGDRKKAHSMREARAREAARLRQDEAEASGLLAAAKNTRGRPTFLSKAGFGGLRSRLGGNRQAVS